MPIGKTVCFLPTEGLEELVKQKGFQDGVYAFEYYPSTQGKYSVSITWGGHHILRASQVSLAQTQPSVESAPCFLPHTCLVHLSASSQLGASRDLVLYS